jgi:hypothetical protein
VSRSDPLPGAVLPPVAKRVRFLRKTSLKGQKIITGEGT